MQNLLAAIAFSLILAVPAYAQGTPPQRQPEGEIVSKPICSAIINRSGQTIMGTLSTASQRLADGTNARQTNNFKLLSMEKKEFCTTGPFYEGRRIEIVLRTLVPLFNCKTKADREIFLDAKPNEDGVTKLSATCY